jgi:hypothetical protein
VVASLVALKNNRHALLYNLTKDHSVCFA